VIPVERTDALLDSDFEVPRPQPIQGNPEDKVVRIQKLGEQQWILLDEAPAESWPRVRNFLISNQIGIEREDAGTGQMETGWLSFKSDATRREKYRFRVEQGVQRASSEIYVLQMGYEKEPGEDAATPEWPAASMDPERETWMIKELANYLASTSGRILREPAGAGHQHREQGLPGARCQRRAGHRSAAALRPRLGIARACARARQPGRSRTWTAAPACTS
jgi:uncharacterized lipoprotein